VLTRRAQQHGFTLIEVIVAMVILAIVLSVGGMMIVNGFAGTSKSINERRAIQEANRTMSSFESAIRSTKSPDRDETIISDTQALSQSLLAGKQVTGRRTPGGPELVLDPNDIVYADASRLVVRADVLPRSGVECVEFLVKPAGTKTSLVRNVWNGNPAGSAPAACPAAGAPAVTETLISTVGNTGGGS
jgi:prepilin-type N-terminal cleavage/methylation domain-containing protein